MSTAVPSATSGKGGRVTEGARMQCTLGTAGPCHSPPHSGGKKCRFRGSSRSVRMGLRRWSGSAEERAGAEQTGPFTALHPPRTPTHHWRRCGATLHRQPREGRAGVNATQRSAPPPPTFPVGSPAPPVQPRPASTGADLDEAVVLYEDGVAGQVPMDDGGTAGVQKAVGPEEESIDRAGSGGAWEVGARRGG